MKHYLCISVFACFSLAGSLVPCMAWADGPTDNQEESVRPIPPPGVAIDAAKRKALTEGLAELESQIEGLRKNKSSVIIKYLPDVEIFAKALSVALNEDGFFDVKEVAGAERVLAEGKRRAEELKQDNPLTLSWLLFLRTASQVPEKSWSTVRGFRSKLDGSVQPYGVVTGTNMPVVTGLNKSARETMRADIWCRGRSEKGLELQFIAQRLTSTDPQPAPGVLMIHPFGRYCNANKLAGEADTLEVLDHVMSEYPIDPKGVSIRGFSMGGAAAWHLAVHYPDKWFAANPGAGFSETPKFLNVFQSEKLEPAPYEQTLWKLYDCDKWALNLRNLPTIAYSGAIDRQKQAADVMAEACWSLAEQDRFELTHIVAPNTAHKVEPTAGKEIERRLGLIHKNRQLNEPRKTIWFTTHTLKYNRMDWLTIDGLVKHWEPATVHANLNIAEQRATVFVEPDGVTSFSIQFDPGMLPSEIKQLQVWVVGKNGPQSQFNVNPRSDRSWRVQLSTLTAEDKRNTGWQIVSPITEETGLRKKHNLQGPIDDAFMAPFVFVPPTSVGQHVAIDQWVKSEWDRAIKEWHRQMRGEVRIVPIDQLKDTDIQDNNVVLWGDPLSNPKIASILNKLPIQWDKAKLSVAKQSFESEHHVPVLIYPNPMNQERYVVLNSSFTYREYDYLNNARQVPKLPDWAIVDVRKKPGSRWPGKIAAAGFFNELWE